MLAALALQGCVWAGYQVRTDGERLYGETPGPVASLQNLDGTDFTPVAIEAIEAARRTVTHPDFTAQVSAARLRPSCDTKDRIEGSAILASLDTALDFSLVARKPWAAIALTDPVNQRVAVAKSRFRGWDGSVEQRAALIGTLVHENLHLVPEPRTDGDDPLVFPYRDNGHGTESCPDDELISYAVGGIAEAVYIRHHEAIDSGA